MSETRPREFIVRPSYKNKDVWYASINIEKYIGYEGSIVLVEKQAYQAALDQCESLADALKRYKGLCVHWNVAHKDCGSIATEALAEFAKFKRGLK
jgi:hypothetical protein